MPPKLEFRPPEPAESHRSWVLELLDHVCGPACVLDGQGIVQTANDLWREQIAKVARPDLAECATEGGWFLNLFAEEPQRSEFQKGLTMPAEGSAKPHVATVDLGTPARPFIVRFFLRALPPDGDQPRALLQAQDATPEHVVRFALLDRERRLRDARALVQEQAQKIQQHEAGLQTLTEQYQAELQNVAERHQADLESISGQYQTDLTGATERHQAELETVAHLRDAAALQLLNLFAGDPPNFAEIFCRAAAETLQSSAVIAEMNDENARVAALAQQGHIAESFSDNDQRWFALCGQVLQDNAAAKFDHLAAGDDGAFWLDAGVGCVWAFPLPDGANTTHVLLLLFAEDDALLPVESYAQLHTWSQIAALLLRASQAFAVPPAPVALPEPAAAPVMETASTPSNSSNLRLLTAGLAEEFGNLLTGVLGHSSLAVAELGENHTALGDVRAIEKAARGAARLTRQLLAISGALHRAQASLDLNAYVKHYVQHDHAGTFSGSALQLPEEPCSVHAEASSLEIILDGLCDHLRATDSVQWIVNAAENQAALTLSCIGHFAPPAGWENGMPGGHQHGGIPEIFFAREAARALGGEVSISTLDDRTELCLTLPVVTQKISS